MSLGLAAESRRLLCKLPHQEGMQRVCCWLIKEINLKGQNKASDKNSIVPMPAGNWQIFNCLFFVPAVVLLAFLCNLPATFHNQSPHYAPD
jgi:hypothetical protein